MGKTRDLMKVFCSRDCYLSWQKNVKNYVYMQGNNYAHKHGLKNTKAYSAWIDIMRRCYDKKRPAYKYYGARGIKVCNKWLNVVNFISDMGQPKPQMTIERVDNNKNYSKNNCKWATQKEQSRNKRTNYKIKFNGTEKCLVDWAEQFGLKESTLNRRIKKYGWDIEKALTKPIQIHRTHSR